MTDLTMSFTRVRRIPVLATALLIVASLLVALAMMLLLGWKVPTKAVAAPPTQLSVLIDDGQDAAQPKDRLDYAITVNNLGTSKVEDLIVSQTIPDGASLDSAEDGGKKQGQTVTWKIDLGVGKQVTLGSRLAVAEDPPEDLLRLASVACVRTAVKGPPLVCASDSDLLPAGATAQAEQQQAETPPAAARPDWVLPAAIAGVALVVLGVIVALVLVRRRHRRELASYGAETSAELVSTHSP